MMISSDVVILILDAIYYLSALSLNMGNGIFCSEVCDKRKRFQKERGNHEIIFLDTQPKGVLTPETAKYLTS